MSPIPCTKMFARILTLSRKCQSWVRWYKPVPALGKWMDGGGPNGHSLLLSKLKASLGSMRPCPRKRGSGRGWGKKGGKRRGRKKKGKKMMPLACPSWQAIIICCFWGLEIANDENYSHYSLYRGVLSVRIMGYWTVEGRGKDGSPRGRRRNQPFSGLWE